MSPWTSMDTAPPEEDAPFLVLLPKNTVAEFVVLQVSRFEGNLYPDHLGGHVDRSDAVTKAVAWARIPSPMPAPT